MQSISPADILRDSTESPDRDSQSSAPSRSELPEWSNSDPLPRPPGTSRRKLHLWWPYPLLDAACHNRDSAFFNIPNFNTLEGLSPRHTWPGNLVQFQNRFVSAHRSQMPCFSDSYLSIERCDYMRPFNNEWSVPRSDIPTEASERERSGGTWCQKVTANQDATSHFTLSPEGAAFSSSELRL